MPDPSSFRDLAHQALMAAHYNCQAITPLEVENARHPNPITARALDDTRKAASAMAEIHRLLLQLQPLEGTVKSLIGA